MSPQSKLLSNILSLLFIVGFFSVNAQQTKVDSLENITKASNDPRKISKTFVELSKIFEAKSAEKALIYLYEAEKVAISYKLDSLLGYIYYKSAVIEAKLGENESAISHYKKSIESNQKSKYFQTQASSFNNLGRLYLINNNFDSAEVYLKRAISYKKMLAKKKPNDKILLQSIGKGYMNLGSMYLNKSDYKSAIAALYEALKISEQQKDSSYLASIHSNIGVIYYFYKDFRNAKKEFKQAYIISVATKNIPSIASALTNLGGIAKENGELKKADSIYSAALKIRLKIGPPASIAGLYENLGLIAQQMKLDNKALEYYAKSLKIRNSTDNNSWLASSYANIGALYLKKKNYPVAENMLLRALQHSTSCESPEKSLEIYINLARLYEETKDFQKSLKYYKEFKIIDDSIHSLKSETTINLFKEKYETAQKDRTIFTYKQKQKVDKLIQEKQALNNNFLVVAILLLFSISFLVFIFLIKRRNSEKVIFEKNQEIDRQKMLELVKGQEMTSINSFISGQEKERARIASDLHDKLGSLLSTVKLHFSSLETVFDDDDELKTNFEFAISLLDQSVSEVRSVSHSLAKEILTEFGIIGAIENLRDAINSADTLKMIFVNSGYKTRLTYEFEIEIYRIIQELVTNAIKHAKAQEIVIQFITDGDNLNITVEDDGVGFDPAKIKSNGLGLANIYERTKKLNGRFSIDSAIGNGTTIIFDIPLIKNAN